MSTVDFGIILVAVLFFVFFVFLTWVVLFKTNDIEEQIGRVAHRVDALALSNSEIRAEVPEKFWALEDYLGIQYVCPYKKHKYVSITEDSKED